VEGGPGTAPGGRRAAEDSQVIAVIMPNDQTGGFDWAKYRLTTRDVERLTGLRFFSAVPEELAEAVRDHLDEVYVSVPKSRKRSKKGKAP